MREVSRSSDDALPRTAAQQRRRTTSPVEGHTAQLANLLGNSPAQEAHRQLVENIDQSTRQSAQRVQFARQMRTVQTKSASGAGARSSGTIVQCAVPAHAGSNADLKVIFDGMLAADSVAALTDQIGGAVTVRFGQPDEMEGRRAFFLVDTRTIVICNTLAANEPDIRHYILIELNHARAPGGPAAAPQPANAADLNQEELAQYTAALDAVRVEYHEWISTYMTHLETTDVNLLGHEDEEEDVEAEAGAVVTPDVVTPRYAAAFAEAGDGWFSFENFLTQQVNSGHAAIYDDAAVDAEWVGYQLLNMVAQPALLAITQDQHSAFITQMMLNAAGLQNAMAARVNPFAGALGTQILTDAVNEAD